MNQNCVENSDDGFDGLLGNARRAGADVWFEHRMFELLGGWAQDEGDDQVRLLFDDHSRRHLWHSQLWFDRLPELAQIDAESLVRASSDDLSELFERLAGVDSTIARLSVAYRVLCPHILVAYRREQQRLDPVASASTLRWLSFMVLDLTDQWICGEETLSALVIDDASLAEALEAQAVTARDLLRSGASH